MLNTFYQGILCLVKAASLLQCPFDDKKDALVTKHLSGRSAGSSIPTEALRSPSRGTSSMAAETYSKPASKRLLRERESRCTPHSKEAVFAPKAWIS